MPQPANLCQLRELQEIGIGTLAPARLQTCSAWRVGGQRPASLTAQHLSKLSQTFLGREALCGRAKRVRLAMCIAMR